MPVSNQGGQVWGELLVAGRNRRGPGSEGGEALARVSTAQALRGEGEALESEARKCTGGPAHRPHPTHMSRPCPPTGPAPRRCPPCWRSWPGSAASWTVCPSPKTRGAGREHRLFSGWRRGARRRPVSDTDVPIGTWTPTHPAGPQWDGLTIARRCPQPAGTRAPQSLRRTACRPGLWPVRSPRGRRPAECLPGGPHLPWGSHGSPESGFHPID